MLPAKPHRAFRVEIHGLVSMVSAPRASRARAAVRHAALDAGRTHVPPYEVRVQRDPEFDAWAAAVPAGTIRDPEAIPSTPRPRRAYLIRHRSDEWVFASTSQNRAKSEAIRALRAAGQEIVGTRVRVTRLAMLDEWAAGDESGRAWTEDEIEAEREKVLAKFRLVTDKDARLPYDPVDFDSELPV